MTRGYRLIAAIVDETHRWKVEGVEPCVALVCAEDMAEMCAAMATKIRECGNSKTGMAYVQSTAVFEHPSVLPGTVWIAHQVKVVHGDF